MSNTIQALEAEARAAQGRDQAAALNRLAWSLSEYDLARALEVAQEAQQVAQAWEDGDEETHSLSVQAWCHTLLSHYEQASALSYQTLERAEARRTLFYQGQARSTLGTIAYMLGDFPQALEQWLAQLAINEQLGDLGRIGRAFNNVALVYNEMGQHTEAQQIYERILGLARQQSDRYVEGMALLNLARSSHRVRGEWDAAISCCQRALDCFANPEAPHHQASALHLMGELYHQQGQGEWASDCFQQAITLWQQIGEPRAHAQSLLGLGILHTPTDPNHAQSLLHQALELSVLSDAKAQQHEIHLALAALAKTEGDYETALHHHEQHHALYREVWSAEADDKLKKLQVLHQVQQARKETEIHRLKQQLTQEVLNLYVTPQVAEYALVHGVKRGGEQTEATALFADLRGFTSLTEQLEPQTLVTLLNEYFDAMVQAISAHGGLVHQFEGDRLYASFGTPVHPSATHAADAVRAARAMCVALERFNASHQAAGLPTLRMGIGIASGPVLVGHVGSAARRSYTVMGDTVNLASRLQELTKSLPATVLLSPTTAHAVGEGGLVAHGPTPIRGKQQPVPLFSLPLTA